MNGRYKLAKVCNTVLEKRKEHDGTTAMLGLTIFALFGLIPKKFTSIVEHDGHKDVYVLNIGYLGMHNLKKPVLWKVPQEYYSEYPEYSKGSNEIRQELQSIVWDSEILDTDMIDLKEAMQKIDEEFECFI